MFPPTPSRNERKLPLAPLLAMTGANYPELADASGYATKSIAGWAQKGVPMSAADWLACRCGFHPCNVWPEFQDEPHTPKELFEDCSDTLF